MDLDEYLFRTKTSKKDFAEKVGMSRPHLHEILRGKRIPSLPLAKKIESATDGKVTAIELLGLADKKDKFPFATAGALTSTAFDVRKELIDNTYPKAFVLKNKTFPRVMTNVKKASKRNLVASVGNVSGRVIDYLSLHAEGGIKTPRGSSLAIPTKYTKRGAKGAVPKAQRPRALLAKKGAFVTSVNGTRVIMQQGKRGEKAQRGGLTCLDRIVAKLSYSFIDFPKPQFLFYVAFFHDKRIHNRLHLEFFH